MSEQPDDDRMDDDDGVRRDILVVDDNPANIAAIEAALGPLAPRLREATSGREALRCLLEEDFALILLDVQMPDLDGFATARLIRQRGRSKHTPIIFVTAYDRTSEQILAGYELGAVDFLFKPIVPEILRAKANVFVELQARTVEVQVQAEQLRRLEQRNHERQMVAERQKWESELLRRENEEQRRINRQLAEADRRKDEFLALLGHELRNPLAPIINALEIVRSLSIEDKKLDWATGVMQRQVGHLRRMVDDLLDVSRITTGKLELCPEVVTLNDVIEQAVAASTPAITERQHSLTVVCEPDDITVRADPVRLTQVLANLMHNAARYTDPGGTIEVEGGILGAEVFLRVRDTGRGIAPELLDSIFEMFVQEREGGRGLGLGLSLVRQLVEMHNGQVTATSEGPGRGSQFEVRLPYRPITSPRIPRPALVPREESSLPPLDIVVVEDDPDIRATVCEVLDGWQQRVEAASDGQSGVDLVIERRPQLVLVDIGLPVLDGYGVARAIRTQLGDDAPYLIAVTGFGRDQDRERALDAGFDAHLVKPLAIDTLRRTLLRVAEVVGHRATADV